MADVRNTGTWQRVERGYTDMGNLISRGEYNLALVKGRQTMEQIIRLRAAKNFVIYTDLAETIDNLYRDGYIGSDSRENCHTIRTLGNKAVHEGDNSPKDANAAFKLLKREMSSFVNGERNISEDRTPVMIEPERNRQRSYTGRPAPARRRDEEEPQRRDREEGSDINLDMVSGNRAQRGSAVRQQGRSHNRPQSGRNSGRRPQQGRSSGRSPRNDGRNSGGVNVYDILRILIPVICIILLVILIKNLIPSGDDTPTTQAVETTQAAPVETEPVTEPPTTEAPTEAVVRYKIRGNNVNVRYEPNTGARIYEQLSDGTEIGEVEEVEGGNWVKITRDGMELYVGSDYITPIEETSEETGEF